MSLLRKKKSYSYEKEIPLYPSTVLLNLKLKKLYSLLYWVVHIWDTTLNLLGAAYGEFRSVQFWLGWDFFLNWNIFCERVAYIVVKI